MYRKTLVRGALRALPLLFVARTVTASPLSITEAVDAALKNNLDYLEQQARTEGAARRLDAAQVLFLDNPEVELEGGRRRGSVQSNDWSVRLSQPVELGWPRGQRVEAAEHELQSQKWLRSASRNTTLAEVRQTYHRLAYQERELDIARRELVASKTAAQVTHDRVSVGDLAPIDLVLAQSEFAVVNRRAAIVEADYRALQQTLNTLIGLPVTADTVAVFTEPVTASTVIVERPELAAAKEAEASARARVSAERRGGLPTIRLFGGTERESGTDSIAIVGVGVPLPIFNRNAAAVADAQSSLAVQKLATAQVERRVAREQAEAEVRYVAALNAYKAIRDNVSALQSISLFEEAFRSGRIGLPEFLIAQRQTFEVERNLNQARLDYLLSWEQLQAASGAFSHEK